MSKHLFHGGMTAFQLVQLRTTISSAVLFAWLMLTKRALLRVAQKDLVYLMLLGITLAATQFAYLFAISKIQVAAAILLQYQAPVLIAAWSVLFGRKRFSSLTFASIAAAVFGCYLMVGGYNLDILSMNRAGIISGLASAVAFALYSLKSEYGMRTYAPWTVLLYALVFAAVVWNIMHPPLAAFSGNYRVNTWLGILFISVFGTVLPYGLYNIGIQMINPVRASITATFEPVIAGMISFIFLNETMGPVQLIGATLVILAVIILQIKRDPQ